MVVSTRLNAKIRKLENLHCVRAELGLRKQLLAACIAQRAREELIEKCPGADDDLADALLAAGFTSGNLAAIALAPLAVIAWASGEVTQREEQKALLSIFDSQVSGKLESVQQFRSWLRSRPPADLMELWERYVATVRFETDHEQCLLQGQTLFQQAYLIAVASGGVFGVRKICEEERSILDRIQQAYSSNG